jgi:hypothetical protein
MNFSEVNDFTHVRRSTRFPRIREHVEFHIQDVPEPFVSFKPKFISGGSKGPPAIGVL